MVGMVLGVQRLPERLPEDYLDTAKFWSLAPERPVGPISRSAAEVYIAAMAAAKPPLYASGWVPPKVDANILRFCLTERSDSLLLRLPTADGVLLRELVVEIHRRKVPERGSAFLRLINKYHSKFDSTPIDLAARAVTAMRGQAGREGAAALVKSANPSVQMVGLIHLARLNDTRALKPLIAFVEGQVVRYLDPACRRFLIERGYADSELGFKRLIHLHSRGSFGLISDLVHRDAAPPNRFLLEVAGNRKEYHRTKTSMIKAMRKADSPRHLPALRKMLGDSWALVRIAAANELVRRRDRASLPLMRKALTLKDEQNRINGTHHDRSVPMLDCIHSLESLGKS